MWVGYNIRGCADKFLVRPTSRCRETESIVSLERGASCSDELQVFFLLQRLKGSMSGDARDFNNIETLYVIKFFLFFLRGKAPKKIHANLTETLEEHAPPYATVKHWMAKFNLLKPNDIYICLTAALTSRRYILNIYSTNIHTEYFKHAA